MFYLNKYMDYTTVKQSCHRHYEPSYRIITRRIQKYFAFDGAVQLKVRFVFLVYDFIDAWDGDD